MDLGVWSQRNVDACFTLIESGTGGSNVAAGDEIRTASRIRVHHHFFPHWLDQAAALSQLCRSRSASGPPGRAENRLHPAQRAVVLARTCCCTCRRRPASPRTTRRRSASGSSGGGPTEYLKVRGTCSTGPQQGKVDGSAHFLGDRGSSSSSMARGRNFRPSFRSTRRSASKGKAASPSRQEYPASDRILTAPGAANDPLGSPSANGRRAQDSACGQIALPIDLNGDTAPQALEITKALSLRK